MKAVTQLLYYMSWNFFFKEAWMFQASFGEKKSSSWGSSIADIINLSPIDALGLSMCNASNLPWITCLTFLQNSRQGYRVSLFTFMYQACICVSLNPIYEWRKWCVEAGWLLGKPNEFINETFWLHPGTVSLIRLQIGGKSKQRLYRSTRNAKERLRDYYSPFT